MLKRSYNENLVTNSDMKSPKVPRREKIRRVHDGIIKLEKPGTFVHHSDGVVPGPKSITKVQKDF